MTEKIIDNYLGQYKLKLNSDFAIDSHFLNKGHWEDHLRAYIQYFVKPGAVCVDVGANIGIHTITMAHAAGLTGKVFAFEPATVTYPRLLENIALNPWLQDRIVAEKLGISDTPGTLKLFASGELQGNAYMGHEYNEKFWNSGSADDFEVCPVTTLDSYLTSNYRVSFIKIDVEGMELEVLRGGAQIIERDHPVIVYESLVDSFDVAKIKACEAFLAERGYYFFNLSLKSGKLMPVKAPHVPPDSLAIHKSEIVRYGDIIFNAAQYTFHSPENSSATIPELEVTIVGLTKDTFQVAIRPSESPTAEACETTCSNGVVKFEPQLFGLCSKIEVEFFDTDTRNPYAVRQTVPGRIVTDQGEVPIIGELRGGKIFNCSLL